MSPLIRYCLATLVLIGIFYLPVQASTEGSPGTNFDRSAALEYSQAAIGRRLPDLEFRDTRGQPVRLRELRGKPLVISLIYTSCYHICPTTTRNLAKVVDIARDALGADSFRVLSIGFDTGQDTVESMRSFAREQGIKDDNWLFLSGDATTLKELEQATGFLYFRAPHGFDHLIQATVVDGSGEIYRQVYGMSFETPLLVEPLKELVLGRRVEKSLLGHIGDRIRLFCTVYDPSADRYRFDYSLFIGILMGLSALGLVAGFLLREWRRSRTG